MLRTNRPLTERMTLVWHDWFATSNEGVGSQRLMIHQNEMLRKNALGSFRDLVVRVTRDPAMLLWLSGAQNREDSPNENYARELMELFTLGADRGYTEDDVREQARALTGFRNDWDDGVGPNNFRFDSEYHDGGMKRIFGKKGRFEWRDSCEMCLAHPSHPSFFVEKLWSYFIPAPPGRKTRRALQSLYVRGRYEVRPVVEAILRHPAFYEGPRMVKPPVVYLAGLLRGSGRWLDTESWTWLSDMMRQRLFVPPNVAGWEDDRWLDTGTWRARWLTASHVLRDREEDPGKPYDETEQPATAVDRALAFWGQPTMSATTRAPPAVVRRASRCGRRQALQAARLLRLPPERPPPAGGHLPRPADELMAHHCCDDFSRAQALKRAAAAAGDAVAPREPGAPAPAGRGLDRRQFLMRSAGLALTVYGATRLPLAAFEEGVAAAAGPDRVLVSVFMAGGIDSLSVLAPVGDPNYRKLRPKLALGGLGGHAVRRGRAPALASVRGRPRDAARRGQGDGHAGRRLRAPGPVALQLPSLLGGGSAPAPAHDRLDGPLPRPRRNDGQPAPGPDPERRPRPRAGDHARAGGRRSRARATTTSGPPASGER